MDAIVVQSNELFRLYRPNINMFLNNSVVIAAGLLLSFSISADSIIAVKDPGENVNSPEFNTVTIQPFPEKSLDRWKEKSFSGNTRYELHDENGISVLKATAVNTASVLYRRETIDITQTPWLEWSWKIESTYKDIDESTKAGDDFPARLYVTAKTGALPWQTIAINYVWSSSMPIDSVWPNPYTEKSIMVSVQSGNALARQWVTQRRNVADDFKQLFNIDVKKLAGYAVMVDGDNSSRTGIAYFGNIEFVAN